MLRKFHLVGKICQLHQFVFDSFFMLLFLFFELFLLFFNFFQKISFYVINSILKSSVALPDLRNLAFKRHNSAGSLDLLLNESFCYQFPLASLFAQFLFHVCSSQSFLVHALIRCL